MEDEESIQRGPILRQEIDVSVNYLQWLLK